MDKALEVLDNLIYQKEPLQKILVTLYNHFKKVYLCMIAIKHNKEKYALLPLMLIIVFGVLSLVGSNRVTFWHYETLLYYLILFPIMIKEDVKSQNKQPEISE